MLHILQLSAALKSTVHWRKAVPLRTTVQAEESHSGPEIFLFNPFPTPCSFPSPLHIQYTHMTCLVYKASKRSLLCLLETSDPPQNNVGAQSRKKEKKKKKKKVAPELSQQLVAHTDVLRLLSKSSPLPPSPSSQGLEEILP